MRFANALATRLPLVGFAAVLVDAALVSAGVLWQPLPSPRLATEARCAPRTVRPPMFSQVTMYA